MQTDNGEKESKQDMSRQTLTTWYCIIGFFAAEILTIGFLYMVLMMFLPIPEALQILSAAAFGVLNGYIFARWSKSWYMPTVDMQIKSWGEIETDMFIAKAMGIQQKRNGTNPAIFEILRQIHDKTFEHK